MKKQTYSESNLPLTSLDWKRFLNKKVRCRFDQGEINGILTDYYSDFIVIKLNGRKIDYVQISRIEIIETDEEEER